MSKEQAGRLAKIRTKAKNALKPTVADEKLQSQRGAVVDSNNNSNKKKTKRMINRGTKTTGSTKKSPERTTAAQKKEPSKFIMTKKKDEQLAAQPPKKRGGTIRRRKTQAVGGEPEKEMTKVDCTVEDSQASRRSVYRKPGRVSADKDSQKTSIKKKPTKINSGEREVSETLDDTDESQKVKRQSQQSNQSNEVVRDLMRKWCDRALTKGVQALRTEFEELRKWTPENTANNSFAANPNRNRYRDVNCLDESRVKLVNHPDGIDYIHANWVHTEMKRNRFICAQGPTAVTNYDFWHLIVQENVRTIVMLCNCMEKNAKKCEQYWPLGVYQTLTFKNITITTISMKRMEQAPSIQITLLKVVVDGKESEIRHFQWLNWPDRGVPKSDDTVFQLLAAIREEKFPIVVHCSAGIGRTGSVVFIELVLEKMHKRIDASDMGEVLKQLRRQRVQSVQTDLQYLYVHHAILKYFYNMRIVDKTEVLQAFFEEYEKLALAAATV